MLHAGPGYRLRWLEDPDVMAARDFDWRDLFVFVDEAQHGSAIYRAINGVEKTEWTLGNHLLARLIHGMETNVWMKTKDATRTSPQYRPEPIPRPGVEEATKAIGDTVMDFDELDAWLAQDFKAVN